MFCVCVFCKRKSHTDLEHHEGEKMVKFFYNTLINHYEQIHNYIYEPLQNQIYSDTEHVFSESQFYLPSCSPMTCLNCLNFFFFTLYFKVTLVQCNYILKYWVILVNSVYLCYAPNMLTCLGLGLGFGLRLVAYILHNLLLLLCVTRALYKDTFFAC